MRKRSSAEVSTGHDHASTAVLRADGVSIHYRVPSGVKQAVRDVTVSIHPGETIGIIGESGSGKTSLTRMLLGLLPPTLGNVYLKDRDLYDLPEVHRFRMVGRTASLVFQDPRSSLNPRLSVGSVVSDPIRVHKLAAKHEVRARVEALLRSVGMSPSLYDRPVRSLSGGQLQRVALARAIAVEPEVIVADEPTSALDVSVQAQVLNLLRTIAKDRGMAMLLVSHDVRAIRFLANTTLVMQNGEVVESGPTQTVFADPQDKYTKCLLAAVPVLERG